MKRKKRLGKKRKPIKPLSSVDLTSLTNYYGTALSDYQLLPNTFATPNTGKSKPSPEVASEMQSLSLELRRMQKVKLERDDLVLFATVAGIFFIMGIMVGAFL